MRTYMTPVNDEHIQHLMDYSHDPLLVEMMGWKPFAPHERQRFIDQLEAVSVPGLKRGKTITFSLFSRDTEELIGFTSLKGIDTTASHAELAIAIMNEACRGQGYGSEALESILSYAFQEMGLARVYLTVFTYNRGAIHLYERSGFRTLELLERSWKLSNGTVVDMLVMAAEPAATAAQPPGC
jgi:RimJ/RimL family protein N-acetyltransferase